MTDEHSPGKDSALPVPDREQIDRLADQFEQAFKAGNLPENWCSSIESYGR